MNIHIVEELVQVILSDKKTDKNPFEVNGKDSRDKQASLIMAIRIANEMKSRQLSFEAALKKCQARTEQVGV